MKIIAIAALIGTISAVQISAPGENLPKWDEAPMFEMEATLSQKTNQLAQSSQKQAAKNLPGNSDDGGAHGGGEVDKGPEPALTKVYQEVDMSSKCSKGVCHVKECFDGKCKTYEKKQPPKFEFQQPDTHWKKKASAADPVAEAKKAEKAGQSPGAAADAVTESHADAASQSGNSATEGHLTIPETGTPASSGTATSVNAAPLVPENMHQNDNLKAVNKLIKAVANRPPTEANKLLLDGIVDDTMIDMDIYSGKKTKEAADILKDKEFAMVKSSEIEQQMVQTNSVLDNIQKLLSKNKK